MFRQRQLSSSQVSSWLTGDIIIPAAPGSYVDEVTVDTPISYWRFEEPTGPYEPTYGASTATVIGTPTREVPGAARSERAVGFPGIAHYVQLGNAGSLPGFSNRATFSWECWFKVAPISVWNGTTADNSAYQLIGTDGVQDSFGNRSWTTLMRRGTAPTLGELQVSVAIGTNMYYATLTGVRWDDSLWHHVVGTFGGGNLLLYVDGSLRTTQAITGTVNAGTRLPVVGLQHTALGYAALAFPGLVDEVAIYPHVLTAERVLAHYQAGA